MAVYSKSKVMTLTAIKKDKNKRFLLSEQVKTILHEKGYLKIFNYQDYNHFKSQVQDTFNKALAIANLFILENMSDNESDFNDYLF